MPAITTSQLHEITQVFVRCRPDVEPRIGRKIQSVPFSEGAPLVFSVRDELREGVAQPYAAAAGVEGGDRCRVLLHPEGR